MKLLLDSHVVLWWLATPEKISKDAYTAIADQNNEAYISVATIWELGIKHKLGRLELPYPFLEILQKEDIRTLSIEARHALAIIDLPLIHQDPFDRMLIAQAKCDDLLLVTQDKMITQYPISTIGC